MDRFQKILNFLLNIEKTSELFKSDANAVNTQLLRNLAYEYTTKDLDFKERLALQREIMEKYTKFYNSLKEPGNELKGVNLVMPYDTDIGVLENVDDGFKHYMDLDYAEMKDLAEQFGYNYDNKKDRLAFLQMIEDRQHHKLHNKGKGGFLKRLGRNLFLGNLDELIEADHKKDLYEKRHGMNLDRELIDKGDFTKALSKDVIFNALEFLNPFRFIKVAKKFPKLAQASYNVGLPASREAMYSHSGDREYNPLAVVMGAAANYGTPIMLDRSLRRFGRRFDEANMTDADKFLEWRNIQQINTKNKDLLDRADYSSKLEKYAEPKLVDIEPKQYAMGDRTKRYAPQQFDSELYFTTKDSDVLTHGAHDNLAKTLDEIKPRWQLTKKSELKARRAIEKELENNEAFSLFRAELENTLGERQAKEATFWLIEYLKDRSPLSVSTEKITDGIVHFLRKNPEIGEGIENYITNKLGREQFGGQFLNIAGGALGNVFTEDSDDTESLTDKISKGMKNVYKKDIKDKYQIKPKDVEIIDKLIQNPLYTLGVGYPLEDHAKIRDIQLIYPDLFSEIQQIARGREGGK